MTPCPKCGCDVADNVAYCGACHTLAGYPNVKLARLEATHLTGRVNAARADAAARSAGAALDELGAALAGSHAVVNVDVEFLLSFLKSDKVLYTTYSKLIAAGVRTPAEYERDRQRTAVESILFGSFGQEIAYAALALDGRGLGSYGPVSIQLNPTMIDDRASVLEENSYAFVMRHRLDPPPGFRSPWEQRDQVGLAKLGCRVTSSTSAADHAQLVLSSDGIDRHKDDFIEVHIFGSFSRRAVTRVTVLAVPSDPGERMRLDKLKSEATKLGIAWNGP